MAGDKFIQRYPFFGDQEQTQLLLDEWQERADGTPPPVGHHQFFPLRMTEFLGQVKTPEEAMTTDT